MIELTDIDAPELATDNESLPLLVQSLGETLGNEYAEQFVAGIEEALEVETNQSAIDAVIAQLTGRTN